MKRLLVVAAIAMFTGLPASSQYIPDYVQKNLADLANGKQVQCGGPFGQGWGTYRITDGDQYHFVWCSYTNSDGWAQIAINMRVFSFDLHPIREFRDLLGRRSWAAWSSPKLTWIGTSNDMFLDEVSMGKYYSLGEKQAASGGTIRPLIYRHDLLKQDYLDRITAATKGALTFQIYPALTGATPGMFHLETTH